MLDEVLAVAAVDPDLADARGGRRRPGPGGVVPAMESCTLAAVTSTARRSPRVSVTMLRFLPTIFFPASMPWPEAGTLVEVLTLWASMTQADGSASRPSSPAGVWPEQAVELGEHALVRPLGEVAVDGVPVREVVREIAPLGLPVRSTYKIASMMSRRSCSGGRPKSSALPRRSKRQAARTGSINSQRASDRSLGYGRDAGHGSHLDRDGDGVACE